LSKTIDEAVQERRARRTGARVDTQLHKETLQLLAMLPSEVKITRLGVKFPRIANRIAADWSRPEVLKPYLRSLLIDERDGRQGFPPEIVTELLRLSRYYEPHSAEAYPVTRAHVWDDQA
jgi:hypothetical protein